MRVAANVAVEVAVEVEVPRPARVNGEVSRSVAVVVALHRSQRTGHE